MLAGKTIQRLHDANLACQILIFENKFMGDLFLELNLEKRFIQKIAHIRNRKEKNSHVSLKPKSKKNN